MRCDECALESPHSAGLPVEAFLDKLAGCADCPLLKGGEATPLVALLAQKHREAAGLVRRLRSKVHQQQRELGEYAAALDRVDDRVAKLESMHEASTRELSQQLALVRQQQQAMQAMSTPIIRVWRGVLALPVIGQLDRDRAALMLTSLLDEIQARGATHAILDLTGVAEIDGDTADHLLRISRAAALLGAEVVLTGIRPAVAQALVGVQADLAATTTLGDVEEALRFCLGRRRGAG